MNASKHFSNSLIGNFLLKSYSLQLKKIDPNVSDVLISEPTGDFYEYCCIVKYNFYNSTLYIGYNAFSLDGLIETFPLARNFTICDFEEVDIKSTLSFIFFKEQFYNKRIFNTKSRVEDFEEDLFAIFKEACKQKLSSLEIYDIFTKDGIEFNYNFKDKYIKTFKS